MVATARALLAVALAGFVLLGCAREPRWQAKPRHAEDLVEILLGLVPESDFHREVHASEVGIVPIRERLRPCCAFGAGLQTRLGSVPVLGFKLDNVIGVEDLGPHSYDSGLLAVDTSRGEFLSSENNGLIYTCHGGFMDTAHVRDYADWMVFTTATLARHLHTGATIELPWEGGHRRLVLDAVDAETLDTYGIRRLAIPLGQWITFQLSLWHEIITWYGWSNYGAFPEYASAFSPEDLYSNLLGINLSAAVIYSRAANTDLVYDDTMTRFLEATLEALKAVPAPEGERAIFAVDGLWWDSSRRLPDRALIRRRYMDYASPLEPWLVPDAQGDPICPRSIEPVPLHIPQRVGSVELASLVRLEIDVAENLPIPFPFPRPPSRTITDADFPAIIEKIRAAAREEFGPLVDRPDPEPEP